MKTLLVDDERLARAELRRLLQPFSDVEIIGDAAHVAEAVERVHSLQPELIFLDIELAGGTGFDVLEQLEAVPEVIFTTAFDQYAVRAFEVNALDYLLKPIEPSRLAAALDRVRAKAKPRQPERAPLERIFVRDGDACMLIDLAEVRWFESEGNYARLRLDGRQPLLLRSLNYLEGRLDPGMFVRANRQQLINLRWVDRIEPGPAGNLVVAMRGGREIEMSRRQSLKFRKRLEP